MQTYFGFTNRKRAGFQSCKRGRTLLFASAVALAMMSLTTLPQHAVSAATKVPEQTELKAAAAEVALPTIDDVYTNADTVTGYSTATTVKVFDEYGDLIGTATVQNGRYVVTVETFFKDGAGQEMTAVAYDADENASAGASTLAKSAVIPPTIDDVSADADTITGSSDEAEVAVMNASGELLGTDTPTGGRYVIQIEPGLTAGQELTAVAFDADHNASAGTSTIVKPTVVPTVPAPTVDDVYDGAHTVTGSSTAARVVVRDADGDILGSANVIDGRYAANIRMMLTAGLEITVTAYDAIGTPSERISTIVK